MDVKAACRQMKVMKECSPAVLEMLSSCGKLKKYRKNEHLFMDRMSVDKFYFVVEGVADLYKVNSKQDAKVIFIYGPGEMLNEVIAEEEHASTNCETLVDSLILEFPRKQFLRIMEQDHALSKAVMDSMALKIRRIYRQLVNTSNSIRLDKQIASRLWKFSRDFGKETPEGIMIDFDMTISFLAMVVGSKRETVSRTVKDLSMKNLIFVRKNRFYVKNRDELLKYFRKA